MSLVLGGLRVRAALNRRLSTPANLRLAVMLGLGISLAYVTVARALAVILSAAGGRGLELNLIYGSPGDMACAAALVLTGLALIWFGPNHLAVLVLAASAVVLLWPLRASELPFAGVAALLAGLTALDRARPPRSWLWWLAALPAWDLVAMPGHLRVWLPGPVWLIVAAMLWLVVDGRIALAALTALAVVQFSSNPPYHVPILVAIAILAVPPVIRMRRQAIL